LNSSLTVLEEDDLLYGNSISTAQVQEHSSKKNTYVHAHTYIIVKYYFNMHSFKVKNKIYIFYF